MVVRAAAAASGFCQLDELPLGLAQGFANAIDSRMMIPLIEATAKAFSERTMSGTIASERWRTSAPSGRSR